MPVSRDRWNDQERAAIASALAPFFKQAHAENANYEAPEDDDMPATPQEKEISSVFQYIAFALKGITPDHFSKPVNFSAVQDRHFDLSVVKGRPGKTAVANSFRYSVYLDPENKDGDVEVLLRSKTLDEYGDPVRTQSEGQTLFKGKLQEGTVNPETVVDILEDAAMRIRKSHGKDELTADLVEQTLRKFDPLPL